VNVAKRGSVMQLLDYNAAAIELEKRVEEYLNQHDQPFIAKFLRENSGKALGTKMDSHLMSRFARFMQVTGMDSISDAMRALVDNALEQFEKKHDLDPNFAPQELPKNVPVDTFEPKPEQEKQFEPTLAVPEQPKPEPVVTKAEPEPAPIDSGDEWVF
jgi:hypothetical protein